MTRTTNAELKQALLEMSFFVDRLSAQVQALTFVLPFAMAGRTPTSAEIAVWSLGLDTPSDEARVGCVGLVEAIMANMRGLQRGKH